MTYSFQTPKGATITATGASDGTRITATVGGKVVIDKMIAYLTFCNVETGSRTAKALKVGEAFIEVTPAQREAITDEHQVCVAADRAAESRRHAEWLASDAGRAETERRRKERAYDNLHNEGADGYNPYRADNDLTGTAFDGRERHYPDGA